MNKTNYKFNIFKKLIFNTIILSFCVLNGFSQNQQEIRIANEYLSKGEKTKALAVFQELAKDPQNINSIHNTYLNLLLDGAKFKQAEDYVEKLIRRDDRISYRLDLGIIYLRSGDVAKADKYLKSQIKIQLEDVYKAKIISDYLASQNLIDYSVYSLQQARVVTKSPALFSLELANLYRLQGKREQMVSEYLDYVTQTPANSGYIKNLLQLLLTKPEELQSLELVLTQRVQQNQQSEVFIDLLIWTNLQQKNFYAAFIQARAYDKRFRKEQSKTLEIAQIALNNKDYTNADKAFTFVTKEFTNTENFLPAQLGLIRTREAKVKKSYPINKDSVRYLIAEYDKFCSRYPENSNSFEARLNQSLLKGYYLNQLDSTVIGITNLLSNSKISPQLRNQAKMELGDIYLLKEEPWEATLLYSQVEKSQRETPLGYEAKLRNAKLSYYKGNFKLAQEHLDILKQATTREIANDAMDLSMKIKENTSMDTIADAMKLFASAELDLIQNKTEQVFKKLEIIKKDFSGNSLLDDVYWLEANLRLKQGQFTETLQLLDKILKEFPEDILADDAYFLEADIYENQLKNKEKAMEFYREFLNKYPGSVYAAEARKRYRNLRGDFVEEKIIN